MPDTQIKLFDNQDIRTLWDEKQEKWYFSIVDIIAALTESVDATAYWRKLKQRLKAEGNETVTNCHALKMVAKDGKSRLTDVADTEQILRIIQSIPSKKAEPFKLWLASVGAQRIDEVADPEIAIQRALVYYQKMGYSDKWISQRLRSIEIRKELTNEWDRAGIKQGLEYALLTDEITRSWSGMKTRRHPVYRSNAYWFFTHSSQKTSHTRCTGRRCNWYSNRLFYDNKIQYNKCKYGNITKWCQIKL